MKLKVRKIKKMSALIDTELGRVCFGVCLFLAQVDATQTSGLHKGFGLLLLLLLTLTPSFLCSDLCMMTHQYIPVISTGNHFPGTMSSATMESHTRIHDYSQ